MSITKSLSLTFFYVFWGSVILQLINVILLSTKDTADVTQKVLSTQTLQTLAV